MSAFARPRAPLLVLVVPSQAVRPRHLVYLNKVCTMYPQTICLIATLRDRKITQLPVVSTTIFPLWPAGTITIPDSPGGGRRPLILLMTVRRGLGIRQSRRIKRRPVGLAHTGGLVNSYR